MKQILLFSLILLWSILLTGQTITINNTESGGNAIIFQDTTISSISEALCSKTTYFLDLDQDSINDIRLFLECYRGGQGSYYYMTIATFNSFTVHLDTAYQEHFQYLDPETHNTYDSVRTRTIIKKYVWGDTIANNQKSTNEENYLLAYNDAYEYQCVCTDIDLFLEDSSYIAFTKNSGNTSSLYYILIFASNRTNLHLISAKTNDSSIGIQENGLRSNYFFPNPVADKMYISEDIDFIEIYSFEGILILKEKVTSLNRTVDVSNIKSGFYIIKLKTNMKEVSTKFIKL